MPDPVDLFIVGAGPVGLTAALEAKRLGLTYRIVDRHDERPTRDSRALVVHARCLEPLGAIGDGAVVDGVQRVAFKNEKAKFFFPGGDHVEVELKDVVRP